MRHKRTILTVLAMAALGLSLIGAATASATGPTYAPAAPLRAERPEITVRPGKSTTNPLAKFAFLGGASVPHECKLDSKAWKRCGAKYQARVAVGRHTFQVRSAAAYGELASKPTVYAWRVVAVKKKKV